MFCQKFDVFNSMEQFFHKKNKINKIFEHFQEAY